MKRSPLKSHGKHWKLWFEFRKKWFKNHPPNDNGYYVCYICGKWLTPEVTTLDHIEPKSRRSDLRYSDDNIRPCCWNCNSEKGSRSLDKIIRKAVRNDKIN